MTEITCELKPKSIEFTEELLRKFEKILLKNIKIRDYGKLIEYKIKGRDIELKFNSIDEIKKSSIRLEKIKKLEIIVWGENKNIFIWWDTVRNCSITGEQNWALEKKKEIQSFFEKYGNLNYLFNFPYYAPHIVLVASWVIMLSWIDYAMYGRLDDRLGSGLAILIYLGTFYSAIYMSSEIFPRFFPYVKLRIWEEIKKYPIVDWLKVNWRILLRDIAIAIMSGLIVFVISKMM